MRTKAFAALVAALLFALLCTTAGAQRRRASQSSANNNPAQASQKNDRPKHVFIGRGSDTTRGSRMTVTADNPLNDYKAYQSGDRFFVELPNANADTVARSTGRGFSDMQVQRRGKSVVLSYRIQPGAKPRVEQRFNRLDVVFDAPGGAQASEAANSDAGKTATLITSGNKNQATQNQTAGQPASQQTPPNAGNERRATPPVTTTPVVTTPPVVTEQPSNAGQVAPEGSQPPLAGATPAQTPAVEQQIAQTQQPNTIAPITNPNKTSQGGFSLGTFLANNWAFALIIALVVAGFGLIIAARRTETETAPPPSLENTEEDGALAEARASLLEAASAATMLNAAEAKTSADIEPDVAATHVAVPAAEEASKAKEEEKWDEELAFVGETVAGASAVEASTVETPTIEESAVETPSEAATVETPTVEAATVETSTVETPSVEEPAIAESVAEESAATEAAVGESAVEEVAVESALVAAEAATEADVVKTESASPATEIAPATGASLKSIALAGTLEQDNVQSEARRLLEGEKYDGAVIGTSDSMARQMIAAELLSALAGRNLERRERARAAFVEHGYFDEKVRDLREAVAPAERAAAARSLAIVGERSATPHLIVALEDASVDVRRAAVEALGELREPAAVVPLESLLERERQERVRIPPRIVRNAIEVCREAAQAAPAPQAPPAETTAEAVAVGDAESTPVVETAPAPVEETHAVKEETAVPESVEAETLVAESRAAEIGLQPFEETEIVVEQTEASAADVAKVAAAFVEPSVAEVEQPASDSNVSEASSGAAQVALFDKSVTVEDESVAVEHVADAVQETDASVAQETDVIVARDAFEAGETPVGVSSEPAAESNIADASDWIDFNVTAQPFGEPLVAESSGAVSETSSGEALTADAAPSEAAPTVEAEVAPAFEEERGVEPLAEGVEKSVEQVAAVESAEPSRGIEVASGAGTAAPAGVAEKGVVPLDEHSTVPASIQQRLASREASERAAAISELSHVDSDEAFQQICSAFDDEAKEVRSSAARALYDLRADRADSFTRALREATPERRRLIGSAISTSGLASEAISQLTGESREKTYEAFSLLFLMAKAGEVHPLIRAIEGHPNNEVRLAVVKLLALSGQKEILPAFRRLAVRGSLPTEVRSAVMEAIYQIGSSQTDAASRV